jgi:hypothetical protein
MTDMGPSLQRRRFRVVEAEARKGLGNVFIILL